MNNNYIQIAVHAVNGQLVVMTKLNKLFIVVYIQVYMYTEKVLNHVEGWHNDYHSQVITTGFGRKQIKKS